MRLLRRASSSLTGSRIPVDYSDPLAPKVAVRLQEVFGLTESPRVPSTAVLR
jgi:hypothetical protein